MKQRHNRVLSMNYKHVPVTNKGKSFEARQAKQQDTSDYFIKTNNQSKASIAQQSDKSEPNTAIKQEFDEVTKILGEEVRESNFLFDSLNSMAQPHPYKSEDRRESMHVTLKEAILNFEKEKE